MIRRRVVVSGRVQGVGFRWSCRRMAETLGVAGWCRNVPDGRVEACFEGADDAVRQALEQLPEQQYDGPTAVSEELGKIE